MADNPALLNESCAQDVFLIYPPMAALNFLPKGMAYIIEAFSEKPAPLHVWPLPKVENTDKPSEAFTPSCKLHVGQWWKPM
jgi:hypothetical protein